MIRVSRRWLALIAIIFGSFLNLVGALRFENFEHHLWALSTNIIFQMCLLITTLAFKSDRLQNWAAWLNIFAALYIPTVVHLTHVGTLVGDYDTWYVTALALLFGAMAVREQLALAIAATVLMSAQVVFWGGVEFVSRSGLAGALMLVFSAIAISRGLESAAKKIVELHELRVREESSIAFAQAARQEHESRINQALDKTLPALREIAVGALPTQAQRNEYSSLAQSLEDEIAGGRLMTPGLKLAISEARKRGVEVTLIDEADIESDSQLQSLIEIAVSAIDTVNVGRIKVLAPKAEPYLLRLTVTRPGAVTPDLDLKLGERVDEHVD